MFVTNSLYIEFICVRIYVDETSVKTQQQGILLW